MKKDTHPAYQDITFKAGSTIKKDFKTEICSNCHPFYTGKQKLVDSSGRVDKFMAKMKKAQEMAEKDVKKVKKGKAEKVAKESTEKPKEESKEEPKEETKKETKEKAEDKPKKKTSK